MVLSMSVVELLKYYPQYRHCIQALFPQSQNLRIYYNLQSTIYKYPPGPTFSSVPDPSPWILPRALVKPYLLAFAIESPRCRTRRSIPTVTWVPLSMSGWTSTSSSSRWSYNWAWRETEKKLEYLINSSIFSDIYLSC